MHTAGLLRPNRYCFVCFNVVYLIRCYLRGGHFESIGVVVASDASTSRNSSV